MVRFGPSGNDVLFWEQGGKSSVNAPAWVRNLGLRAFEVNFGRGLRLSEKMAAAIGEESQKHDVLISAHAPYFINLASEDPAAIQKSYGYIARSLELLRIMGGRDLVVHIGSQGDLDRDTAINNCKKNLKWVIEKLEKSGFSDFPYRICIETMGRYRAVGNYREICDICAVSDRVFPTIDFGHINCLLQGELQKNPAKFGEIMDYCTEKLGRAKMQNVHIHFSGIKFGPRGELAHTVIDDPKFGIPFAPLARYIKQHKLTPTIICESAGIMAQDAVKLKKVFDSTVL
jgi:deoxyribonuclease-4